MKHSLNRLVTVFALGLGSLAAHAGGPLVHFNGGIGVTPWAVNNAVSPPAPTLNTVFDVPPGGRPWVIDQLRARIGADGQVRVSGTGLILSGGNGIGTSGGVPQVIATLFCGGLAHDSPAAPLALNGDFSIQGLLSAPPPSPCLNPVLLVRNAAGNRAWFAAGIPVDSDD